MQPETVKQYAENLDEVTNDFLDNIRYFASLNADQQMPEDFQNEIHKWALESIGVIALDTRLGKKKTDSKYEFYRMAFRLFKFTLN